MILRHDRASGIAICGVLSVGALLLGAGFAVGTTITLGVLAAALFAVSCALFPVYTLALLTALLSIDVGTIFGIPGLEGPGAFGTAHKAAILYCALTIIIRRGISTRATVWPLVGLLILVLLAYTVSDPLPGLTPSASIFSLMTLSVPWILAAAANMTLRERLFMLDVVSAIPLISVAASLPLAATGFGPTESSLTDIERLQGATIPAYLGAYCAFGIAAYIRASYLRGSGQPVWFSFMCGFNVVVLLLTGARGALAAAIILGIPYVINRLRRARDMSLLQAGITLTGLVVVPIVVTTYVLPFLLARTEAPDGQLNTSGRLDAWSYFVSLADISPWFGRGIGSGPIAAEEAPNLIRDNFTAQHNEYIRFFLEGGWVGLVTMAAALIAFFVTMGRHLQSGPRINFIALAVGFLVFSATDNTLSAYALSVPFGIVVGSYCATPSSVKTRVRGSQKSRLEEQPVVGDTL